MQYLALSEIDSENISEVLNNILSKRNTRLLTTVVQIVYLCPPSMQCGFFIEKSINCTSLNSILDPPPTWVYPTEPDKVLPCVEGNHYNPMSGTHSNTATLHC